MKFKDFNREFRLGRKMLYLFILYLLPKAILFDGKSLGAIPEVLWFGLVLFIESKMFELKNRYKKKEEEEAEKTADEEMYSVSGKVQRPIINFIKEFKGLFIGLAVLAVLVGIAVMGAMSDTELTPVAEPRTGDTFEYSYFYDFSYITVSAPSDSSCVVKLKTPSGDTRMSFYVRAGDTVTAEVPNEPLYVYFASGKTWYGEEHLFGKKTDYYMDSEIVDFSKYTISYTLYPVTDGNFSHTPIDKSEFD